VAQLGDNKTRINLKEKVTLEIEASSPISASTRRTGKLDFCVKNMPGMDAIIGLPDILDHSLDIFIDILESGRYRSGSTEDQLHLTAFEDLERRYVD